MTPEMQDMDRRVTVLETIEKEREQARADWRDEVLRRLSLVEEAVNGLSLRTQGHLNTATCLNGAKAALQWGSVGGGVVATVVLLGKLLKFW